MTAWCRLWEDMPTDPKWRTIARKSGQRVGDVIAVFNFMMVNANANEGERGTLQGFKAEDVATALDLDDEHVEAILEAMQGRVLDGQTLTGWKKRQPRTEDGTAAIRKARWQERQKAAREKAGTSGNGKGTVRNGSERNGTAGHGPEAEAEAEDIVEDDVDARAIIEAEFEPVADVDALDPDGTPTFARQCAEAAGLRIATPTAITTAIDLTRLWLTNGATQDEILTCIKQGVANAPEPIHSLRYFDAAIRQTVARRRNGVAPTPRRPTGRRSAWTTPESDWPGNGLI